MSGRLSRFRLWLSVALRGHGTLLTLLLLGIVVPWVIFVEIAEDIWESGGFIGDNAILEFFHRHAAPVLDKAALAFTALGAPAPMMLTAGVVAALLFWRRERTDVFFFLLSVCGAIGLNVLAKAAFGRPRPALWVSLKPALYYSFPSGHAMGSAALAAALAFLLWPTGWRWPVIVVGALFALAVGFSRMYLGVHYPSDVLAGWVGSIGWVCGLHFLFSPYFHQLRTWWRSAIAG